MLNKWPIYLSIMFVCGSLSACSNNLTDVFDQGVSMSPSEPSLDDKGLPQMVRPSFSQFQDIPIPDGAKMNMDRTLIVGENDSWIGRLVIDSQSPKTKLFDFFKYRTGQFGWREITSVRSNTSVLSYQKKDRIMTIQIQSKSIIGTRIDITMSPKGAPNNQNNFSTMPINPSSLRPVEIQ